MLLSNVEADCPAVELHEHAWCLLVRRTFASKAVAFNETAHALLADEHIAEIRACTYRSGIGDELIVHGAYKASVAEGEVDGLLFTQESVRSHPGFVQSDDATLQSGAKVVIAHPHFLDNLFGREAAPATPHPGIFEGIGPDEDKKVSNVWSIVFRKFDDVNKLLVSGIRGAGG